MCYLKQRNLENNPEALRNQDFLSLLDIPVAPDNPFLGHEGRFVDYVHYENLEQPEGRQYKVGAITPDNLMRYRMQRLNYNPDFLYMVDAIERFIG